MEVAQAYCVMPPKANNQNNSKPKWWSIYSIVLFFPLKGVVWVGDGLASLLVHQSHFSKIYGEHIGNS